MHDLLKKKNLFKIQQSFQEVRFHVQSVLIPCKGVTVDLNKAAILRQHIDDAWKRSRFNRS